MKYSFAVVGSCCVDIFATSIKPIIARDSNPGTVQIGFGGVGRNIAENLARLEQNVDLFAAFGSDVFSTQMLQYTSESGVCTGGCLIAPGGKTPFYIAVNDSTGDMAVAVNDMGISDLLTPEILSDRLSSINAHDAVVIDANLPKRSIDFLAQHCAPPLYADAVSVSKATKFCDSLPRLYALNCNLREAQALLQENVTTTLPSLTRAAARFHALGITYVLITLGAKGAFLSTADRQLMMSAFPTEAENANGCGDAFSAAAFVEIARGRSHEDILSNALAAAALTAQSAQSVSDALSPEAVRTILQKARKTQ